VKFLSALAADGTIPDVEGIISSNLSAGFDTLKENVSESMSRQEKILASVQVCRIVSCEDIVIERTPQKGLLQLQQLLLSVSLDNALRKRLKVIRRTQEHRRGSILKLHTVQSKLHLNGNISESRPSRQLVLFIFKLKGLCSLFCCRKCISGEFDY